MSERSSLETEKRPAQRTERRKHTADGDGPLEGDFGVSFAVVVHVNADGHMNTLPPNTPVREPPPPPSPSSPCDTSTANFSAVATTA